MAIIDQRESYALAAGEPLRLEISWGFLSREIVIYLDNQEIGRIKRSKITKPHEFILNDDSVLTIQQIPSFKILGMGFQPYLRLSLDGQDLPGLISSPEQNLSNAYGWIILVALMKFLQSILSLGEGLIIPKTLQLRDILEWQQGFGGSLTIALILLLIFALSKQFTKQMLIAALVVILGDFLLELTCVLVCQTTVKFGFMASAQGLASVSLYQSLKTLGHSQSS
ncbi:hypothetical protein ACSQ6I_04385 [Anabaena sp. WFMT]|uniref:hypothetical protein n=1 Tax=Anabaena sp. WFMT TaxID=3449730 RepID=UPI003F264664